MDTPMPVQIKCLRPVGQVGACGFRPRQSSGQALRAQSGGRAVGRAARAGYQGGPGRLEACRRRLGPGRIHVEYAARIDQGAGVLSRGPGFPVRTRCAPPSRLCRTRPSTPVQHSRSNPRPHASCSDRGGLPPSTQDATAARLPMTSDRAPVKRPRGLPTEPSFNPCT